jgi:hypothetical protein
MQGSTDTVTGPSASATRPEHREGLADPAGTGESDRFSRLSAAGASMRGAVRDEVQAAVGRVFELVLERARADLQLQVGRLKTEVGRELEALAAKVHAIEETTNQQDPALRSTLDRIAASLEETRAGVLRLQARYLPGSTPSAGD